MTKFKEAKLNKTNKKIIALEATAFFFFGASFVTAMWFAPLIAQLIR